MVNIVMLREVEWAEAAVNKSYHICLHLWLLLQIKKRTSFLI
jgi:hypothetical protein